MSASRSTRVESSSSGRVVPEGAGPRDRLVRRGMDAGPGPAPAAAPAGPSEAAAASAGSPLLLIFVFSLFIPGTLPAGPLQLAFYKLILVFVTVPLGWRLLTGRAGPIMSVDIIFFLFTFWIALSLFHHHGASKIIMIGRTFMEYFGTCLVGRTLIRSPEDFRTYVRYFLLAFLFFFPFALVEFVTGKQLLKDLARTVLTVDEHKQRMRIGFNRTGLSFPGVIQFGVVCSLFFANAFYVYWDRLRLRIGATAMMFCLTSMALSSAGFLTLMLQSAMIFWDKITGFIRGRWVVLVVTGIFSYAVLELSLPKGVIRFIIDEMIFNPIGGSNRLDIIRYGLANIQANPVFGLGLNEWEKPYWQKATVDNFWIVIGMRYGA